MIKGTRLRARLASLLFSGAFDHCCFNHIRCHIIFIAEAWRIQRSSSATAPQRLARYATAPGKERPPMYSNLAVLVFCGINGLEELFTHSIQLVSFQNSNLGERPITGPHIFLAQPRLKWHTILTQWQAEHGVCEVERQRIRLGLLVENCPPLFVSEAWLVVIEGPCDISNG